MLVEKIVVAIILSFLLYETIVPFIKILLTALWQDLLEMINDELPIGQLQPVFIERRSFELSPHCPYRRRVEDNGNVYNFRV